MSVLPVGFGGGAGGAGYQIEKSLRFRASASARLERTFGTPTSSSIWTYSTWVKRGALTGTFRLLGASTNTFLTFNSSDQINLTLNGVSAATSTAVFRDPSAHYHIVYRQNGSAQTIWVNNQSVATGTTAAAVFNTAIAHQIGAANTSNFLDGYLSETNFIDGQALDPSAFGEADPVTGVWIAKDYTGTYGNNGFYLPFNDGSNLTNLCLDRSGNGNNWTATNISLTAGATYDWMDDTPTNNFAVLNEVFQGGPGRAILSEANLRANGPGSTAYREARATFAVTGGKWYWESLITTHTTDSGVGIYSASSSRLYTSNGNKFDGASTGYGATYTTGDVIGVSLDLDAGTITFLKNNVSQGVAFTGLTGEWAPGSYVFNTGVQQVNFGQRPFTYTPPTGFLPLNSRNLPAPAIANPAEHFDAVLDTGANIKTAAEAVYTDQLVWTKDRVNANSHQLIDSVRGTSAVLISNSTGAETTYTTPSGTSVGWVWRAQNTGVSNTDGSISSTVSANTTAGFSIVTYTGTGANATVGHGLGVAPRVVIVKCRNTAGRSWPVYHAATSGSPATQRFFLNQAIEAQTDASVWNNTAPTSSVFSVGTSIQTNGGSATYLAYCFAEIAGFSKFGSYAGNASADGPFIYCGFRPKWFMLKRIDLSGNWQIFDAARGPINLIRPVLFANDSGAEANDTNRQLDFVSNGVKLRQGAPVIGEFNASGGTYAFVAFAESPFNYARAR